MAQFSNSESGASVRTKINAAIAKVDELGTGDKLLMTAVERTRLAAAVNAVESDTTQAGGGTAIANLVEITQAAYDALATPDADTTYLIVG